MVVANKDLNTDACWGGVSKYCIATPLDTYITPGEPSPCDDASGVVYPNENDSVSYSHVPKKLDIVYTVYRADSKKTHKLHFTYKHGKATDNCNQVFDGDVKCVITKSGSSHHRTYTLTISNNS